MLHVVLRFVSPVCPAPSQLVERTTRTDADVRQLRADMESELQKIRDEELKPLRAEVEALKQGRWPLAQLGALVSVGGLVAAVVAFFVH
ncbi:hypothetical protein ACWEP4_45440 [Streptomyces sp. NPDC004227]